MRLLGVIRVHLIICIGLLMGLVVGASPAWAHSAAGGSKPLGETPACAQPPVNLDLSHLSNPELLTYGLPDHSVIDSQLDHWTHIVTHAQHHGCERPVPTGERHYPAKGSGSAKDGGACSIYEVCYSSNWGGIEDVSARGTYRIAEVAFTVPTIDTSNWSNDAGFWAGVGGDAYVPANSGQGYVLVQAGVDTKVSYGNQYNVSFIEVEPDFGGEWDLPLCRLNAGDTVLAYVSSNYNDDGYDYFYLGNESANCYNSCYISTGSTTVATTCVGGQQIRPYDNSDSATAECIAERVTGAFGSLKPLAAWNAPGHVINLNTCYANYNGIFDDPYQIDQIYNGCGSQTNEGNFTSTSFDVTWICSG